MNPSQLDPSRSAGDLTNIWLRSAGMFCDLQSEAARNLLKVQARNAAMFGAPDFTPLIDQMDQSCKSLFMRSAEQMGNYARQTTETLGNVQNELGRALMDRASAATENLREGMEQIDRTAREGLNQFRKMAQESQGTMVQASQIMQSSQAGKGEQKQARTQ